jgi:hypothetical protein
MALNQTILIQVANEARAKAAGNSRWLSAINRAVEGLQGGWIVTELADCLMVTTESGETYRANGVCQCKAFELGQPCKHRAAARLIEMYNQAANQTAPTGRCADLIETINATWTSKHPRQPIADALMARFRCNQFEMLSIDFLARIQEALSA